MTGNLFWTEVIGQGLKDKGYVAVSKNDGRYKRWIVTSGLEEPTAIAVDPQHGMVFWADAGNRPKIESSWMDGSRRRAIVTSRYVSAVKFSQEGGDSEMGVRKPLPPFSIFGTTKQTHRSKFAIAVLDNV